ncbi:unnamed protein product [Meloidogyne enterolobii]|uniref:Uncharacterized protein n=1 Tax=Meloidogyne enterolobii TaxID=390850 RepID=A0ACB0XTG7_MELEN
MSYISYFSFLHHHHSTPSFLLFSFFINICDTPHCVNNEHDISLDRIHTYYKFLMLYVRIFFYSRILITCGNVKKHLGCVAARSFIYKQISNSVKLVTFHCALMTKFIINSSQ